MRYTMEGDGTKKPSSEKKDRPKLPEPLPEIEMIEIEPTAGERATADFFKKFPQLQEAAEGNPEHRRAFQIAAERTTSEEIRKYYGRDVSYDDAVEDETFRKTILSAALKKRFDEIGKELSKDRNERDDLYKLNNYE